MSALARMLHHRGLSVLGTDSTESPETLRLRAEGIDVSIGHSGEAIQKGDAVILTDAIDLGVSPEVKAAKELDAPIFRRSQALGWLLRDHKVIAVTGTHGKTTTTGMIGAGLQAAGLDPLIVVGASVPQFGGPVVEGKGEWAVVEACEAYDSYHDIRPFIVVLTNLELDHVDFHGTYENLRESVVRFVQSLPKGGSLIYCATDEGAADVATRAATSTMDVEGYMSGDKFEMAVPGEHNRLNAAGALAAIAHTGAPLDEAKLGIAKYTGAERRLQVAQEGPVTVIDDYAHHPSEILASLSALRERYPYRRLIVVYQPHLYSRTAPLINEFAAALSTADLVVLTDIYPAREAPIPGVSSARIAEHVTVPVRYVPNRHLLPLEVAKVAKAGDVVVGMGAGTIGEFANKFVEELKREGRTKRIAVCYGGDSAEREISILSGREIHAALERKGYDSELVDVSELLTKNGDLGRFAGPNRPDLALLAVHGTNAENGAIQGLFELLHIPYTGSGIQASAIGMDKAMTKRVLETEGLRVPLGALLSKTDDRTKLGIHAPLIVKPNAQGSTVGLSFVEEEKDVQSAIEKAFQYDEQVLVEEWVKGTEISVPVLGDRALPAVEIAPVSGRYDFESKYTPGATEEIIPARLPQIILDQAQKVALMAHRALGCEGATRTDMIVANGDLYILEVNTLPGMTSTSLLPNSARAAGIEFDDLVVWLVEDALRRYGAKT